MVPFAYVSRNLVVRWRTTMMTALGFTLVVGALTLMLAFVDGVRQVCSESGDPRNVIVISRGNQDEILSRIRSSQLSPLENERDVARGADGHPLASREVYLVNHHYDEARQAFTFLQVRGVSDRAFAVHEEVTLVDGRRFRPGAGELIVGVAAARDHGLAIGSVLAMGRRDWRVVGLFAAGDSAFESEIWTDLTELASQFRRDGLYSSLVLRAYDAAAATALRDRISDNRTAEVDAFTEPEYYADQADQASLILAAAWVISAFMGIGAVFGVMNTMFAAISQRTKDIAVLRIIGFSPREILVAFLCEALLIALIGGACGLAVGYAANGFTQSTAVGGRQIEFAFRVTPEAAGLAAIFSLTLGLIGGLVPALTAMRVRPLEALR